MRPSSVRGGAARVVLLGTAALGVLTWGYHLALSAWIEASDELLGALHYRHAVPLYSNWNANLGWKVAVAAAVLGLVLALLLLALARRVPSAALVGLAVLAVPAIGLSVSWIDPAWDTPHGRVPAFQGAFSNPHLEYYGDVRKVDKRGGPANFLKLFARIEFHDRFTLHSGTHPPGPILFLWAVAQVAGPGLLPAALAAIAFTALGLVPAFLLAREVAGEATARIALVLMLLAPSAVLFTTTSMDGPFGVFPIAAAAAFHRSLGARGIRRLAAWAGLMGTCVALGLLMSYVTFFTCLYMASALGLALLLGRTDLRRTITLAVASLVGFLAVYAAVVGSTGFRPIAALRLAIARDAAMMGSGHETLERYLQISFGNLGAFLIGAGLPIVALCAVQLRRAVRRRARGGRIDVLTVAFAAALVAISFSTLFTLETERIWMGMVPFLAIPAGRFLELARRREGSWSAVWVAAALLGVQVLLFESFLNTRW